jgi:hypothetical protein
MSEKCQQRTLPMARATGNLTVLLAAAGVFGAGAG